MRIALMSLAVATAIGLTCCGPKSEQRSSSAARQAGRETHQVAQDLNQAAQQAQDQLRRVGRSFQQGWNEVGGQNQRPQNPPRQGPSK